MQIEIKMFGKIKLAKMFLSNIDQKMQCKQIAEEIKALKNNGCTVVVYRSGKADLISSTSALLRRNS